MAQLKATYKEIIRISLPLILGNTAWTAIGVFDTIFIGNYNKDLLGAIGIVSMVYSILFMIGFSYTRGTQLMIARSAGELNYKRVGDIFDNSVITLISLGLVLFLVMKFGTHYITSFLVNDPVLQQACNQFLEVRAWGIFASFICVSFIAFYSGIGETLIMFFSVLILSILNIGLNYLLVFGKHGFPEMGIIGSAWASNIAEYFAVFILIGGTFYKKRIKTFFLFKFKNVSLALMKEMSLISIPLVLQSFFGIGGWLFLFSDIEHVLGPEQLGVSTILRQLYIFFSIPVWSLGSTTSTMVSNLVGQNNMAEIKDAVKKISIMSVVNVLLGCVALAIAPSFFIGLFTDDQSVIPLTLPLLKIIYVALVIMAVANIFFNAVISLGDIWIALGIEFVVIGIYIVYFKIILALPGATTMMAWTSELLYWILILVASILFFRRRKVAIV
jgi:MATE family multidrug resistance protein